MKASFTGLPIDEIADLVLKAAEPGPLTTYRALTRYRMRKPI